MRCFINTINWANVFGISAIYVIISLFENYLINNIESRAYFGVREALV